MMTMTIEQLAERVGATRAAGMVPVTYLDREEFAVALVLQGYDLRRALGMASVELLDNDGALQMLARRRIATEATRGCMNDRELGAVLAGLRALQNVQQHEALAPEIDDVMTGGGMFDPLDDDEIDALCERLNTPDR